MQARLKFAIVFSVTLTAMPLSPVSDAEPAAAAKTSAGVVIRSSGALADYLKATPVEDAPLSLLPPGARKRFLDTLVWGRNGVAGFDKGDLAQYLTGAQIHRVLALFDLEAYAAGVHGRARPLTPTERNAPETPLERDFDKYYFARANARHDRPHPSPMASYDRLLAPWQRAGNLATLNDNDVGLLFRAASGAAFDSGGTRRLDDLQLDLAELHRRTLATTAMIASVHKQLVAARDFRQANALAGRYPAARITPLPTLRQAPSVGNGDPTVLLVQRDGESLLRKPVAMNVPLRIVVVAGCHYSVDAVRAIRADPELGKLFHDHAVWLAPESESLTDVLDWNRDYPDQPMNVAWRSDEWHMLESWDIPTFYVFRDGKQVDQWSGWGASGMSDLVSHLREDGVIN